MEKMLSICEMLGIIVAQDVKFESVDGWYHCDPEIECILIDEDAEDKERVLAHELGHAFQMRFGMLATGGLQSAEVEAATEKFADRFTRRLCMESA